MSLHPNVQGNLVDRIYRLIRGSYSIQVVLVAVAYYFTAHIGGALAILPEQASPLFPAVSISFVAAILGGYRLVLGVFFGAFIFEVEGSPTWYAGSLASKMNLIALVISLGASAQAFAGAWLIKRCKIYPSPFEHAKDITGIILFAGPVACLCSPTIAMTTFYLLGDAPAQSYALGWFTWWVGDSAGAVLFTAPMLILLGKKSNMKKARKWGLSVSFVVLYVTMVLFFQAIGQGRQKEFLENFEEETLVRTELFEATFAAAKKSLHAVEGLFLANEVVSREAFKAYTTHMFEDMAGVQAIEWIPRVLAEDRTAFETRVKTAGFPDFRITERNQASMLVSARKRNQYFPVFYVEPFEANKAAFGFDLGSNKKRLAALNKAVNSNKIIATAPITLVQESSSQKGILVFNAVYKTGAPIASLEDRQKNLKGFALGVFRIGDMLGKAFSKLEHPKIINIHVEDVTGGNKSVTLYGQPVPPSIWFNTSKSIDMGGRQWRVSYTPTDAFGLLYLKENMWLLLFGGLVFSCLCVLLILMVAGRGSLMQKLVDETLADLAETRHYINGITDNAPVLLSYVGSDMRYRFVNATYEKWFDLEKKDIIGTDFIAIFGVDKYEQVKPHIETVMAGELVSFDETTTYPNGETRFVHATYTPDISVSGDVVGFFISVEDVSTLKQSQAVLLEANESLEQGVQKRTASLELINTTTVGANLATNMLAAMMNALTNICIFMDWPIGHYYQYNDKTDQMDPSGVWYLKEQGSFAEFRAVTEATSMDRGVGIPGQILNSAQPLWLDDLLRGHGQPRHQQFIDNNFLGGGFFPVMVGKQVVAVLEFFDTKPLVQDDLLQETMATIGTQLGRVIERSKQEDTLQQQVVERTAELAEKEKRLQSIIDNAVDGFVTIDDRGTITAFNPAAEAIFGYTIQEVLGKSVSMLMPGLISDEHDGYLATYRRTGQTNIINTSTEREAIRKCGTVFPIDLAINQVDLSKGLKIFTGIIRDITDRKNAESAVLAAKETAETANKQKSEFLAVMSHEIRTPMNGIMGMTDLLLDTKLTARQRNFAETTLSSAEALLNIINDILDFSKIEAGKVELDNLPFDMMTLMEDISDIITPKCAEKGIELLLRYIPGTPRYVLGDPGKVRQVLLNLASNAIKFTDDGHVLIDVGAEQTKMGQLKFNIRISDTGIGVADDKQELIFNQFDQADQSTTRKYGGTGLGLPICKRLVALMQGDIGIDSTLGEGSSFWFNIVLEENHDPEFIGLNSDDTIDLVQANILIVDDNRVAREIIAEQLLAVTENVQAAESGAEAIHKLKAARDDGKPFDFMVTDYRMPEMDGLELARLVREDKSLAYTKIVVVTSCPARGDGKAMDEVGISGYLSKPVRAADLHPLLQYIWDLAQRGETPNQLVTCHTIREAHVATHKALVLKDTHILLADDNPVNQMIASIMLKKYGSEVTSVVDGKQACDAVAEQDYDLVIMDCQMPEMDGYEATRQIRASKEEEVGARLPIIAFTANAMKGDREKCLAAGMDDYLSKPVNKKDMEAMLVKWLPGKIPTE